MFKFLMPMKAIRDVESSSSGRKRVWVMEWTAVWFIPEVRVGGAWVGTNLPSRQIQYTTRRSRYGAQRSFGDLSAFSLCCVAALEASIGLGEA
jgi:hypothetical protein